MTNDERRTTAPLQRIEAFILIGVLWLAFGLRAYHLDFQSFWSDEGISVLRSGLPLGQMLREMPVEHVPGYFVLLHFWLPLTGGNDFALRFFALWPSVLSVALAYRLAVELGRNDDATRREGAGYHGSLAFAQAAGMAAALLLATSAFQVWYAQELRMYSWLLAAALASNLFFWRLICLPLGPDIDDELSRTISWLSMGYALTTALAIYLHYYGFLVPLAQTVFIVGWTVYSRKWRTFVLWTTAGIAVFLLFLPWLPRALDIFGFSGWREAGNPWLIPWRYLTAYTVGDPMAGAWRTWLPWLYGALTVIGAFAWWRRRPLTSLFLLVQVFVPLGVVFLLALRNPDFHERYLIAITGPLLLLIGGGIAAPLLRLRGEHRVASLQSPVSNLQSLITLLPPLLLALSLAATNGLALDRLYHDESLHKPEFRGAAQRIQRREQPGDVILVDGPDPEKVFLHYYRGDAPVHDLRPLLDADGDEVAAALTDLTADAPRAWGVLYFHTPGPVQHWLATHGWSSAPSDHNDIRVTLYGMPHEPLPSQPLDVAFGPDLVLERAAVSESPLARGDLLRTTTEWQVLQPLPDYKFSLRLVDGAGNVVLADDYAPQNWFAPTSTWAVGPGIDRRSLLLPTDLSPGPYRVTLRLYDPATGVAMETEAGPDVTLAEVAVE